jgi:hypothetical protein
MSPVVGNVPDACRTIAGFRGSNGKLTTLFEREPQGDDAMKPNVWSP